MVSFRTIASAIADEVKGAIIALQDDSKLRLALKIVPQIECYRYQIDFKLVKAQ